MHFIFICFFIFVSGTCWSTNLLRQAEIAFDAGSYEEAIPLYLDLLKKQDVDPETGLRLNYQLAVSYFFQGKFKEALHQLESNLAAKEQLKIYSPSLYLAALSHKHLGEYEKELSLLTTYQEAKNDPLLDQAIKWELGLVYFKMGKLEKARPYFLDLISQQQFSPHAELALVRIEMSQQHYKNAEKMLALLEKKVKIPSANYYEWCYLRGDNFYHMQHYQEAALYLEKAIPRNLPENSAWYSEALYHLGWSYLKLADDDQIDPSLRIAYFNQSGEAFKQQWELTHEERATLGLGYYYLTRGRRLQEGHAFQTAEFLLSNSELFSSAEGVRRSQLMRAEASSSYSAKEKWYKQLTEESQDRGPFYTEGWYLRGLNDFNEGLQLLNGKRTLEASRIFEKAIVAFSQAAELFEKEQNPKVGLAIKYEVLTYSLIGTKEFQLKAYEVLEAFLNKPHHAQNRDELAYLKGYLAFELAQKEDASNHYQSGKDTLLSLMKEFPDSEFADQSLYLLGMAAYQKGEYNEAKEDFVKLTTDYPESSFAGNSFFWLSKSEELLKEPQEIVRAHRRVVFEKFPNSQYGVEAYFTYYTFNDYLYGEPEALLHLQKMPTLFPESPTLLNALYLIGCDLKKNRKTTEGAVVPKRNLTGAIDAFQEVESTFDRLHQDHFIPEDQLIYTIQLRYRAILERALANLAIAEESKGAKKQIYREYAIDVLNSIISDFEDPHHALTSYLNLGESFCAILEESEFGLAQAYLRGDETVAAEKQLQKMLTKYKQAKVTRGYYLSRVWKELASVAMNHQDYQNALTFLASAEEAGKGKVLNADQKLDIWIQQSLCLKEINQTDQAMLVLSKVINEDVVSGLRLKAMYLRAELYEVQGRPELARKQLEATAKKSGEWAEKAKIKLQNDYHS